MARQVDTKVTAKKLPRGRHGLPQEVVARNQRQRITVALAAACAAKGYRLTTVEDIITAAGVSRRTFYDLFSGKEDCFIAAYETLSDELMTTVAAAQRKALAEDPYRIDAALRALLGVLAAQPTFARLLTVEVLVAGERARLSREYELERLQALLLPVVAQSPLSVPQQAMLARAVIGGVCSALYTRILAGATAELPQLRADLLYCLLVPYVGHVAAKAAVAACEQYAQ